MAQQTINVGAAPNDGTGTPLRTAFQYTNNNFSELYTALGGGVGLPGATTQVIFNDGGTNLAGDAGLVYNKTTDALTVGGLVTAGSATITGALTANSVSSSSFVIASGPVAVNQTSKSVADFLSNSSRFLSWGDVSNDGSFQWYTGIGAAAPNLRMTLNSTGLGVGGSPNAKVSCAGFSSTNVAPDFQINRSSSGTGIQTGPNLTFADGTANNTVAIQSTQGRFGVWNYGAGAWNERFSVDSSGNLGISVTPSAWRSNYKSIEIGRAGSGFWSQTDSSRVGMSANTYIASSGQFIYSDTSAATYYNQFSGQHQWFTAPSGTAGNNITFTQAMTLDASGNLLVGTTNTSASAGVGFKANYSATVPAFSVVVNDAAGTGAAYTLYNTNAAAYRFYVSNGGTIFATNTTISAISDARLKENVQDLDVGLGAILALKPRKFDWKEGKGKNIKGDRGFIAQEFETVFPNLIDEWKDEAPEGEAPYKSVRQDLIPVLVKAIQELTARVQTLEAR
jgi:hypothetical protein